VEDFSALLLLATPITSIGIRHFSVTTAIFSHKFHNAPGKYIKYTREIHTKIHRNEQRYTLTRVHIDAYIYIYV